MIRINQLKLNIKHSEADLKEKILKVLRISEDSLLSYEIKKQSLDARRKPELFYVYAVDVKVKNVSSVKKRVRNQNVQFRDKPLSYQIQADGTEVLNHRPVVIGTGPAGLFCGYQLAVLGYRPILLERGACVEERMQAVERFWATGELDQNCNVQFGEGAPELSPTGSLIPWFMILTDAARKFWNSSWNMARQRRFCTSISLTSVRMCSPVW